jgi:hypothetical protein
MAMRELNRRIEPFLRVLLSVACLTGPVVKVALADEPIDNESSPKFAAQAAASKPLNLLLTREELRSVVRDYEARTGENLTAPIDENEAEVVVKGRGVLAPMRDVTQEPWGGIAAPFWAIMHPTQAWRIFLPIPPKGPPTEDERPVPDPR